MTDAIANLTLCDNEPESQLFKTQLNSSVDITVCMGSFYADNPRVLFNSQPIPRDHINSSITYSWTAKYRVYNHTLTIRIRNITVDLYGDNTVSVAPGPWSNTLYYTVRFIPTETNTFEFYFQTDISNGLSDVLICNVSWYPKYIEVEKEIAGVIIAKANNSIKKQGIRVVSINMLSLKECQDSEIYSCGVTDFRDKRHKKEYIKTHESCGIYICEKATTLNRIKATPDTNMSLIICLINHLQTEDMNISATMPGISKSRLQPVIKEIKGIHYEINITILNIQLEDNGDYTVNIDIIQQNRLFTLLTVVTLQVEETVPVDCFSELTEDYLNISCSSNQQIQECKIIMQLNQNPVLIAGRMYFEDLWESKTFRCTHLMPNKNVKNGIYYVTALVNINSDRGPNTRRNITFTFDLYKPHLFQEKDVPTDYIAGLSLAILMLLLTSLYACYLQKKVNECSCIRQTRRRAPDTEENQYESVNNPLHPIHQQSTGQVYTTDMTYAASQVLRSNGQPNTYDSVTSSSYLDVQ